MEYFDNLNIKFEDPTDWLLGAAVVIGAALFVWILIVNIRRCCKRSSSYLVAYQYHIIVTAAVKIWFKCLIFENKYEKVKILSTTLEHINTGLYP